MLPKHIVPNAKFVTITRFNPLKVSEWTESVISALGFLDALHFLTRRYIQAPYEKTIDEKALTNGNTLLSPLLTILQDT